MSKLDDAVALLQRARRDDSTTDDGLFYGGATFYDSEIKVAYVNHQTAKALQRRGIVEFGPWDPDWGCSITLTVAARQEDTTA